MSRRFIRGVSHKAYYYYMFFVWFAEMERVLITYVQLPVSAGE